MDDSLGHGIHRPCAVVALHGAVLPLIAAFEHGEHRGRFVAAGSRSPRWRNRSRRVAKGVLVASRRTGGGRRLAGAVSTPMHPPGQRADLSSPKRSSSGVVGGDGGGSPRTWTATSSSCGATMRGTSHMPSSPASARPARQRPTGSTRVTAAPWALIVDVDLEDPALDARSRARPRRGGGGGSERWVGV